MAEARRLNQSFQFGPAGESGTAAIQTSRFYRVN